MTPFRRPVFWHLLRRADVPWHRTEEVLQHLRDAETIAGTRPAWDHCAGPVFNPFSEDEWVHAAEDLPWIAGGITRRRGHDWPSDNDNRPLLRIIVAERAARRI